MKFDDLINKLSDRLPFGITFEVSPEENWIDTFEVLPGIKVNRYKDLTASETWFGNIITELNGKKSAEAQIEIKLLGAAFKDTVLIEYYLPANYNILAKEEQLSVKEEASKKASLQDAFSLLFKPIEFLEELQEEELQHIEDAKEDPKLKKIHNDLAKQKKIKRELYKSILESTTYSDFILENTDSYQRIADLSKIVENDLSIQMVVVTFFMRSRHSKDWSFSDTAKLPLNRLDLIYNFYKQELNKGEEILETVEPLQEYEEDLGKS